MNRAEMDRRLYAHAGPRDMIVVGGGATGAGVAIDGGSLPAATVPSGWPDGRRTRGWSWSRPEPRRREARPAG